MTWRQTLGFIDETTLDLSAVQTRYQTLRDERNHQVCERRRLKQAVEAAQRELTQRVKAKRLTAGSHRLNDPGALPARKISR